MKENGQEIGAAIKAARKHARLSQTELAKRIGTSHAAISFWENNVNVPNVADCWKIADILDLSIDELIGRR